MYVKQIVKKLINATAAVITVTALVINANAALDVAGTLLVDLSAQDPSAGSALWVNNGTLGDFSEQGVDAVLETVGGVPAVSLNGDSWYLGPNSIPSIEGNQPRTIEVWAYNPAIAGEETLVSWSKRGGPDGSNMSFNYGSHASWGAAGHWGAPDLGWNNPEVEGAPAAGQWHHLVYSYDGAVVTVYADGEYRNSDTLSLGTHANLPIRVGAQVESDLVGIAHIGSLSLGSVRVHDGALNATQVENNFEADRVYYGNIPVIPELLSDMPRHRWSFNDDTANDSLRQLHGTTNGGMTISGGQAHFDGIDDYISLTDNTGRGNDLAELGSANGAITIETWGTYDPNTGNWSRIVDMGRDATDPALGADYVIITPRNGANGGTRVSISDADPGYLNENFTDGPGANTGLYVHIVAIFDDATDTVSLYMDGELISTSAMAISLNSVNDALGYFGRALYPDPFLLGSIDEIRIYDYALNAGQILGNFNGGANAFNIPSPSAGVLGLMLFGLMGARRRNNV